MQRKALWLLSSHEAVRLPFRASEGDMPAPSKSEQSGLKAERCADQTSRPRGRISHRQAPSTISRNRPTTHSSRLRPSRIRRIRRIRGRIRRIRGEIRIRDRIRGRIRRIRGRIRRIRGRIRRIRRIRGRIRIPLW